MYHVLHRHLTPQAFTLRPCSFSNLCCGEIDVLAFFLRYFFAIDLLKCSALWTEV